MHSIAWQHKSMCSMQSVHWGLAHKPRLTATITQLVAPPQATTCTHMYRLPSLPQPKARACTSRPSFPASLLLNCVQAWQVHAVGPLRRSDIPLAAIDFHVSDILPGLLAVPQVSGGTPISMYYSVRLHVSQGGLIGLQYQRWPTASLCLTGRTTQLTRRHHI